jgi:F420-0:gamma-glutamyl ligase
MEFIPIKTTALKPPKSDIFKVVNKNLPRLKNGDVLFITSKILAIHQGRTTKLGTKDKYKLIKQEADFSLPMHKLAGHKFILTIKDHTLIPNAGIDESNGNGFYVLWPKNTQKLLKEIWQYLRKKNKIKNLGVVATDSHTIPLRWGTLGISTGFYGINPLKDYRGAKDIFGRKLQFTQSNIIDALSAAAVLFIGEGKEKTPMLIARGLNFIKFSNKDLYKKLVINSKDDIYAPLLKQFRKRPQAQHQP